MKVTKKKQKRIWVSDEITRKLKTEFATSGNTILVALKFGSYSTLSKNIRERAMQLIKDEAKDNLDLFSEFHT